MSHSHSKSKQSSFLQPEKKGVGVGGSPPVTKKEFDRPLQPENEGGKGGVQFLGTLLCVKKLQSTSLYNTDITKEYLLIQNLSTVLN